MRRLVTAHVVFLSCVSACTMSSAGDDVPPADRLITATWSFKTLATNTIVDDCPAGFDTASVIAKRVDVVQDDIVFSYACAANTGTPVDAGYPPGIYHVVVQIENGTGGIYGVSLPVEVDVTATDRSISATLLDDGGYFGLKWELFDATTNQVLSCSEAGNPDAIEITSTLSGTSESFADPFDCEDLEGVTAGLPAGTYTVSVRASDAAGGDLGSPQNFANQVVGIHNQVTDLGVIRLPVN